MLDNLMLCTFAQEPGCRQWSGARRRTNKRGTYTKPCHLAQQRVACGAIGCTTRGRSSRNAALIPTAHEQSARGRGAGSWINLQG